MIIHDVEQRTPEWFALRVGTPTASNAGMLVTPTGKKSSQIDRYANMLVAERLSEACTEIEQTQWMERGVQLEGEARAWYELHTDQTVAEVGFVTTDDKSFGASPDGMTTVGLLEIKCPAPHTHIEYLLAGDVPQKYIPQLQAQMWVCESPWCDFVSYSPGLPPLLVRVEKDPAFQATLAETVAELNEMVLQRLIAIKEKYDGV